MASIKREYETFLKENLDKQIFEQQDNIGDISDYLRRLSALVELERFIA